MSLFHKFILVGGYILLAGCALLSDNRGITNDSAIANNDSVLLFRVKNYFDSEYITSYPDILTLSFLDEKKNVYSVNSYFFSRTDGGVFIAAIKVKPGTLTLENISLVPFGPNFNDSRISFNPGFLPFNVRAGEVKYIGDIIYEIDSTSMQARATSLDFEKSAINDAKLFFPNILSQLAFKKETLTKPLTH